MLDQKTIDVLIKTIRQNMTIEFPSLKERELTSDEKKFVDFARKTFEEMTDEDFKKALFGDSNV